MKILRTLRLKGRATTDDVAAATALDPDAVREELDALVAAGDASEQGDRYRLTPDGRTRLEGLLALEQAGVDRPALEEHYERFTALNTRFKELAARWQTRDGAPNDHTDASYDAAILDDLGDIDVGLQELLPQLLVLAPRLDAYPRRFARALRRVQAGDHAWFLRPIIDSYHTVWFELHEELIGLTGRTRAAEAFAGRAE